MKNITHNKKIFFHYNDKENALVCPYCNAEYTFNNHKVMKMFNNEIKISDDISMLFRCIECSIKNTNYPFRLSPTDCNFIPNEEQSQIIIDLYQQMLITSRSNDTNYFFLIEGQAGTGKTSTIGYLFQYPELHNLDVVYTSPTNKALSVLMSKMDDSVNDNDIHQLELDTKTELEKTEHKKVFMTLYKLLGNKTSIGSTGETLFGSSYRDDLSLDYDIIVIDEASMIEKNDLECILNSVNNIARKSFTGVVVPIVIFMGDDAQLPPVKSRSSLIFDEVIQKKYTIKKLLLTRIMRSRDQLSQLSQNVRKILQSPLSSQDMYYINLKHAECERIKYFSDRNQWLTSYTDIFHENLKIKNNSQSAPIILVYTNNECDSLNMECRNRIFNDPVDQFMEGELLVFKTPYNVRRESWITDTQKQVYYVNFFTSEQIIVKSIKIDTTQLTSFHYSNIIGDMTPFIFRITTWVKGKVPSEKYDYIMTEIKALLTLWTIDASTGQILTPNKSIDQQLNKICSQINKLNHVFEIAKLYVDGTSKLDKCDTTPDEFHIQTITQNCMDKYKDNCDKIKTLLKSQYNLLFQIYRQNTAIGLVLEYLFQQIWKIYYYKVYVWPFADVVYGYSMTTHKSQGSTYNTVFVNISNIMGCNKVDPIVRMKSMYTAMTRSSSILHVLHQQHIILPLLSATETFCCNICHKQQNSNKFPSINCHIDKLCADKILSQIIPLYLYESGDSVIFSDKNKNLYQIDCDNIHDKHINDALSYIIEKGLTRMDFEKYQQSNLALAINVKTLCPNQT